MFVLSISIGNYSSLLNYYGDLLGRVIACFVKDSVYASI